jgi:hypothetical protein
MRDFQLSMLFPNCLFYCHSTFKLVELNQLKCDFKNIFAKQIKTQIFFNEFKSNLNQPLMFPCNYYLFLGSLFAKYNSSVSYLR